MEYVLLGSIAIIATFLITRYFQKTKSDIALLRIRQDWGNPKSKNQFAFHKISRYTDISGETFHRLSDQTIQDIDLNKLFMFIDRTTSKVGQQFLYRKVIEPTENTVNPFEDLISLFSGNVKLREGVQVQLHKLSDEDAYHIASLFGSTFLKKPKWFKFLFLDLLIIVVLCALSFKYTILVVFLLIPFTFNLILHLWNKNNTFHFTWSIPQLNILISVSEQILKNGGLLYDKSVETSIVKMKSFQRYAKFIRFTEGGATAEIGQYVIDMLKAFFLIEVFMLFKLVSELKNKQSSIRTLFDYIGKIDTCISIAALRAGKLKTCKPTFIQETKSLAVKEIYHPLIKNCTKNSLSINGRSILITGSNMSGKSTFLRTLTINSVLAQTIYTCFADEYCSPILKQFSSIRIDDNLFEGKSYYFEEVSIMGSILSEAQQSHQNLFVLDEVFKGTNTVERISAAKAILSYLNRGINIVIVSTHDIELAEMLEGEFDLYHFTETIESAELNFDHKIKPGYLKTRNAIKILELANYPTEIVNEARRLSENGTFKR